MATPTYSAASIFQSARKARWRKWVAVCALACTIGVYSIELTHDHETLASQLGCPICHVMAHSAPNLLKPNITPVFSQLNWFSHFKPAPAAGALHNSFAVKPQTRAPPVFTSSLV
ncbi:MAG TPA: hypothetical protein VNF48_07030 [Gammaproteobacteria bacterium]|nr:hypothetical protein [Gammaproteobacteria bacterium]